MDSQIVTSMSATSASVRIPTSEAEVTMPSIHFSDLFLYRQFDA